MKIWTASLGVFLLSGCELVQAFFHGAGEAVVEKVIPKVGEGDGDWIATAVGGVTVAVVGGVLEVMRRRRKKRKMKDFLKGAGKKK